MKLNAHAVFAWIVIPAVTWGSILWLSCQAPVQAPAISAGHRSPAQPAGPSLPSSPCQPVSPAPHGNLKQTGRD